MPAGRASAYSSGTSASKSIGKKVSGAKGTRAGRVVVKKGKTSKVKGSTRSATGKVKGKGSTFSPVAGGRTARGGRK